MALQVPEQKNVHHFLMPTSPQNGVEQVCFMRLALLGGIKPIFKNCIFLILLQYGQKTKSAQGQRKERSNQKVEENKPAVQIQVCGSRF